MATLPIVPTARTPMISPSEVAGAFRAKGNGLSTAKEWYLFFQQLRPYVDFKASSVTSGPHASRLKINPDNLPDGAIWTESDRGNSIYQLQDGKWILISGGMSGTLTPDQRPTDLGAADAGFLFAATDTGQTLEWSGTAWVDITSRIVVGLAYATSSLA